MKMPTLLQAVLLLLSLATPQFILGADLLIIDSAAGEPYKTVRESMIAELALMGFKEDSNLTIKYWSLGNNEGMARRVWIEEKDTHYDAIFINGTIAALNFHKFAFGNLQYKFVFGAVTDPIGIGLIDRFNNPPKSNFTGICYPVEIEERLRFIKKTLPSAKDIGFVHTSMPQSQSYLKWLKKALSKKEFKDLRFHFRSIPFVKSEGGHIRMAMLAEKHIKELDARVDVFLSPNDQMGVQSPFAAMVYKTATKPLIGLGKNDVMEHWGATMSFFPSLEDAGKQAAQMVQKLLIGTDIKQIPPQWPHSGVAFDLLKAKHFDISIPKDLLERAGDNIIR